jgi:excisionase family DNA binding protein
VSSDTPHAGMRADPERGGVAVADDSLWDVAETAEYLRLKVAGVYRLAESRDPAERLPHVKIGALLRFRREDIDRWLDARAEVTTQ